MLGSSSKASMQARVNSANLTFKKIILAASLFVLNSILQDFKSVNAITVLEQAKTQTGLVALIEVQPTENEFTKNGELSAESCSNPLSSAIVEFKNERKAEFSNVVALMKNFNAKFELENAHLSEYLVDEALTDLINRLRLTLKMLPEEKEKVGSWAFYTCYENDILYLVDRADDFDALADLIATYDLPIRMNAGVIDFDFS